MLNNETRVPIDINNMSGRYFLERVQLMSAHRMPHPRADFFLYRSHQIPLAPPLPGAAGRGGGVMGAISCS